MLPELEMNLSTYPGVSFSRGICWDVGMVDISMVFQVLFRVKCMQLELSMCNTCSLSDNYLTIDQHDKSG